MKRSRWIFAALLIAVAGIVIAKQAMKTSAPTEQAAKTSQPSQQSRPTTADRPSASQGSGQPALSFPPPARKGGGNPQRPITPSSQPAPRPVETRSEADHDHHGPLPGSDLADCLKNGLPTMADFGRTWCKPCKAMVPILKQAAQDYRGKANILFVDLGKHGKLGRQHRIRIMPTQVFFDAEGKEISRHVGFLGSEGIERQLGKVGARK